MKLLKKIVPIALGAALMGFAVMAGAAHAADLGSWKSNFPASNTAVVVGSVVTTGNDPVAATEIANELGLMASSTSITGESVALGSGDDRVYLGNDINVNVETVSEDDLANVLKQGTFEDDDGDTTDYDQTLEVGTRAFTLDDADGNLDNSALMVDVGDDTADPLYILHTVFDSGVDFTAAASKGQEIELFGKKYTVGTATTNTELQLFGSGTQLSLVSATPSGTAIIGGVSYTVTVIGVNVDGDAVTVKVEKGTSSETKTVDLGASKKINGINIFVKDSNAFSGQQGNWQATILVGADEIYLKDATAVKVGPDKESIDGTLISLNAGGGTPVDDLETIDISIAAEDSDVAYLLAGNSFTDPVFGSVKVVFTSVPNGPTISDDKGTDSNADRYKLEFKRVNDDDVSATFAVKGNTKTIDFDKLGLLSDKNDHKIIVVEGATVSDKDYTLLNSGEVQRMVKVEVDCTAADDDSDDLTLTDVFTGETIFSWSSEEFGAAVKSKAIGGQTFDFKCDAAGDKVHITAASHDADDDTVIDSGESMSVYPYLETLTGKDTRVAFTQDEADIITDGDTGEDWDVILPTGTINIAFEDGTGANECMATITGDGTGSITMPAAAAVTDTILVGTVYYTITVQGANDDGACDATDNVAVDIALEVEQTGAGDTPEDDAGVLFVEDKDKSDGDDMNAVIIPTETDTGFDQIDLPNVVFSSAAAVEGATFDNSDYTASIDPFGTYIVEDTSDEDQDMALLTYPKEQMYADLSIAESNAVSSTTGSVAVMDKDVTASMKTSKNLIVIGGSGANTLAAELLGLTFPTYGSSETWQTATGVTDPGMALVKLYADKWATGKTAMLVAGFTESDTTRAAKALTTPIAGLTGTSKLFTQLDLEQFN
jgi:hypothetical protein